MGPKVEPPSWSHQMGHEGRSVTEPTRRDAAGTVARQPRGRDTGVASAGHRFEDLLAAEQVLVTVRWAAVLFGVYLVASYGGPAPQWVPTAGFTLAAVLALTNTVAVLVARRVRTLRDIVRLAFATLVMDTLVVSGFVWVYTFDEGSVHFLLFFVLPATAALKFRLVGALGMWAAIAVIYAARQTWATATYGFQLSVPSIVFRMGILLIVAGILGLFAQRLSHRAQELSETLARLRREERWQTALINMLAHDFRSPMGTAISSLETVDHQLDVLPTEDVRRLIAAALRQSRRGLALAENLLTMARARADHLELQREDVEVPQLLRRATDGISDHEGWVRIDAPAELHTTVDPARAEQIVTNLLSNARKHGKPPVVLTARPLNDAGVQLHVSDAGDGVAPEHRDSLFTQFAGGPRQDSVGLGLWLVDLLAAAHGGRASYAIVEEQPTFTVTLPGPAQAPARDDSD